jgi:hypothetical protein
MREKIWAGGCQCGAIRFGTTELLENAHICHCRMCQKAVGNYFAALVSTPKAKLVWTRGQPSRFRSSAQVDRGFCQACGTPLFYDPLHWDEIGLTIGSFDALQDITLRTQDSIESRMPWFSRIADVPEAIDGPDRSAAIRASNRQHPDHDTAEWPPSEENR